MYSNMYTIFAHSDTASISHRSWIEAATPGALK